jgi:hypothetical protein
MTAFDVFVSVKSRGAKEIELAFVAAMSFIAASAALVTNAPLKFDRNPKPSTSKTPLIMPLPSSASKRNGPFLTPFHAQSADHAFNQR